MAKKAFKICKEAECKNEQTTQGYCRLHYIKNWKNVREKQRKKAAGKLNKYVDHIMKRHPDSYVENIKHDLRHPERFRKRAEEYTSNDDFTDVVQDIDMNTEVENIVDNIKVDESF